MYLKLFNRLIVFRLLPIARGRISTTESIFAKLTNRRQAINLHQKEMMRTGKTVQFPPPGEFTL